MKQLLVFLFVALLSVNSMAAKVIDKEQQQLVEELIKLIDDQNIPQQFKSFYIEMFTEALAENMPESGEAGKKLIETEVNRYIDDQWNNKKSFQKRAYSVISLHFTKKELQQLVAFYSSDLGKKALATMPEVYSDTMGIARLWGHGLEKEIREYISKKIESSDLMNAKKNADTYSKPKKQNS